MLSRLFNTSVRRVSTDAPNCTEKVSLIRDVRFKKVDEADVNTFRSIVGGTNVIANNTERLQSYNDDWFGHYHGTSTVCVLPRSTAEVSKVLEYCNEKMIAVCPQGGNTGFVGGSVPVFDEIVLSTRKLDKVTEIDEVSGTIRCGAGCVLQSLDEALAPHGYMMPVDLGAKGSCVIGGNISTNAGGVRFMRYGSLRGNILGCSAVLATGRVLDLMTTLKKDNTGYDLKQLFVGSEGTLGVVTEVAMQLPVKPKSVQTMFLGVASWEKVCATFSSARSVLAEVLSAVEMIDGDALRMCLGVTKATSPLSHEHRFYLLLETNGSNAEHDSQKLTQFLEGALESGLIEDGTLAQDAKQAKHIWSMRESCAVAPNALGHVRWYDISMPVPKMYELVDLTQQLLKKNECDAGVIAFGHLGDGNLHLNVISRPSYDERVYKLVDTFVYEYARDRRFSVSAEHGIGLQKKKYLSFSKPDAAVDVMRGIKALLDPNGILNPYKIFTSEAGHTVHA